jgi:hypothetical protein
MLNNLENDWTVKQEKLLQKWAEKGAGYRWLHNNARIRYKYMYDVLSYPTIILSSITGIGGFAILNPRNDEKSSKHNNLLYFQYMFAFMNVISSMIISISKFNNSLQLSQSHSTMCIQYSKFYRNIDMELSLERNHRINAAEFVLKCRQEYDRLLSDAPDIPETSIKSFNKLFPDKLVRPDVCNGLNVISHDVCKIKEGDICINVEEEDEKLRTKNEVILTKL